MKVLWLCNLMPAMFHKAFRNGKHNKEGWIIGAYEGIRHVPDLEVAFAFPVPVEDMVKGDILRGTLDEVKYYGFYEDISHPEKYDESLESSIGLICEDYRPDVIHCFGTEFPHTKALMRVSEWKGHALIHMQGVMAECEKAYTAGLPQKVIEHNTLRDVLRSDGILRQQEKYALRADNEMEVVNAADYFCVRTAFDEAFVKANSETAVCYSLNETLRPVFYEGRWNVDECDRHSIFISQGNIPLKGLHIALGAMAKLIKDYPDITLTVAGDDVVRGNSLSDIIKRPSYGKYLKQLIKEGGLEGHVRFAGPLSAKDMKKEYLKANVYVLPSSVENSPNSLGEAMLLGVPCIASYAGGIPSMAEDKKEARLVPACDVDALASAIVGIFDDDIYAALLGENAAARAKLTFDREANSRMLKWIYDDICKRNA